MESGLGLGGVDGGLEEAGGGLVLGVVEGDKACPQRSYGAGAADDHGLAIDTHVVSGGGVSVAADVGDAAAGKGPGERHP